MRVLSVVTQVKDDAGEPVGVVAVNRDITKRVIMEEAVKASEAEYRELFENAPYGIYRSTTDGRFTAVNPALVRMLRYESAEELLQIDIAEDLYADPTERDRFIRQQTTATKGFHEEALWRRKDGKRIAVALKGRSIFGSDGEIVGFEAMAEDVTEQRQLESQLRQAQKMEAIGQLTGGIAHDFNNELLVILLNTQMLTDGIERGQTPQKDELNDIKEAAQRAAEITQQLVGFSRQAALKRVPTNLAARVKRMSSMLSRILRANIHVRTEVDDSVSSVSVDPNSVEQMLLNLTTNSQHAMPDGGELTVRVWEDSLDQDYCERYPPTTPGRYVLLSVTDTGVGMTDEVKAKIFEPFFTTRPVGEGTGLGMAMVYGLTKQQQGFVHVDTEPGSGTCVRLAFPVVEQCAAAMTAEHEVPDGSSYGGKETILFVDDEEALRRVGRRVLESHGFTVVVAQDGVDALEKLQSGRYEFDLVITDLMMPNMGGVELCSGMGRLGIRLPIILASGHSHRDIPDELVRESPISYIRKPWDVTEMLTAVREALDR
jgi:PAS domain S-box-containing protein